MPPDPPTTSTAAAGPTSPWMTDRPVEALGLVVAPVAFVTGWVVGGARTPGYSPLSDAISRIAAAGAPERVTMTVAFLAYGGSILVGSQALRGSELSGTWALAVINGLATFAVAATPLEHSSQMDLLHGISATVGYVSISALPIVASRTLRARGHRRAAAASVVAGAISAACLVATVAGPGKGAFQRIGLLSGDVWLIAAGLALWRTGRAGKGARAR